MGRTPLSTSKCSKCKLIQGKHHYYRTASGKISTNCFKCCNAKNKLREPYCAPPELKFDDPLTSDGGYDEIPQDSQESLVILQVEREDGPRIRIVKSKYKCNTCGEYNPAEGFNRKTRMCGECCNKLTKGRIVMLRRSKHELRQDYMKSRSMGKFHAEMARIAIAQAEEELESFKAYTANRIIEINKELASKLLTLDDDLKQDDIIIKGKIAAIDDKITELSKLTVPAIRSEAVKSDPDPCDNEPPASPSGFADLPDIDGL